LKTQEGGCQVKMRVGKKTKQQVTRKTKLFLQQLKASKAIKA
jgi:hypothetical protein